MVHGLKVLSIYQSFGGNTAELNEYIRDEFMARLPDVSYESTKIRRGDIPDIGLSYKEYDLILIGAFTIGKGQVQRNMQDFYVKNIVSLRDSAVYYFGTGDTQFGGDELFCNAIDILNSKAPSSLPPLKVEQSVRGSQEKLVGHWVDRVLKDLKLEEYN